jgi:hypothetical protein
MGIQQGLTGLSRLFPGLPSQTTDILPAKLALYLLHQRPVQAGLAKHLELLTKHASPSKLQKHSPIPTVPS